MEQRWTCGRPPIDGRRAAPLRGDRWSSRSPRAAVRRRPRPLRRVAYVALSHPSRSATIDDVLRPPSSRRIGPSPAPSATIEPLPSDLPADLAYAVRQANRVRPPLRPRLGDQTGGRGPTGTTEALDFLMLPEEESRVLRSPVRHTAIAAGAIQRYAEGPTRTSSAASTSISPGTRGRVALDQRSGRPPGRGAQARAAATSPIVACQVRWSEKALRDVQDQIDWDWFGEVDADGQGVGRRHHPQRRRHRDLERESGRTAAGHRALRGVAGHPTRDAERRSPTAPAWS